MVTTGIPGTAPELIRDLRAPVFNNMYYIYIYLPAGRHSLKQLLACSWDVNYGGTGGVLSQNGANFSVTNAGYYRLVWILIQWSMIFVQEEWDLLAMQLQPAGILLMFSQLLQWCCRNKPVCGHPAICSWWMENDWQWSWNNGSNAVDETRSYGSTGGDGSTMEVNGAPTLPLLHVTG